MGSDGERYALIVASSARCGIVPSDPTTARERPNGTPSKSTGESKTVPRIRDATAAPAAPREPSSTSRVPYK